MNELPFSVRPFQAAAILNLSVKDVNMLARCGKLEELRDPHGRQITVKSLIYFLGFETFEKRWPGVGRKGEKWK